jgi:hypothetical protein
MEKAKTTVKKSGVKENVIANPAEGTRELLQGAEGREDLRNIVQWGDEKNTLPYYLL